MYRRCFSAAVIFSSLALSGCSFLPAGGDALSLTVPKQEEVSLEAGTEELPTLAPLEEDTGEVEPASEERVSASSDPQSIGFITYYPSKDDMAALAGTNQFTIYFEKPNIQAGIGEIELYETDTGILVDSIDVSDPDKCVISGLDDNGSALTDWTEGSKAEIYFNKFFTPGASYYILMDKGCFMNGEVASKGIENASYLAFDTKEYGIKGVFRDIYNFGDTIELDTILGGKAVRAAVLDYDTGMVNMPQNVFVAPGDNNFQVTFISAGKAAFRIAFYDEAGMEIDSVSFSADVMGTAGGAVYSDEGSTLTVEQTVPANAATHVDTSSTTTNASPVTIQDNTTSEGE